jgi:threonine aldolase
MRPVDEIIDLRSDAETQPTQRMRQAMSNAPLGDESLGEDPTVRRFEEMIVERFGFEAALLTISATMANLVALLTHGRPGDEVIVDREAHVMRSEAGGMAVVAGLMSTIVETRRGHVTPDVLSATLAAPVSTSRPRLVWLENSHNRAGGTVMRLGDQREVARIAHDQGLAVHVDGARIFHAAEAQGLTLAEVSGDVDSMAIDLTKALCCPLGAVLLGNRDFIDRARAERRMLGGGMRQAGVIAACALVAFEDGLDQVAANHELARRLASGLSGIEGFRVSPADIETNLVLINVAQLGTSREVGLACERAGVLVYERAPDQIRLVTHHQITDRMADLALLRLEEAARSLRSTVAEPATWR